MERTAGSYNTPGFPLRRTEEIVHDIRGFKKVELRRNNSRILQTSKILVQSWRANCDVQIILYDSDPKHPSPTEIAKATDYIVGYACKGNETLIEEKKQMTQLVLQAKSTLGNQTDIQRVARQLLNRAVGEKMISKQEAMVHIGGLDLFSCSETIETHSLSNYHKLSQHSNTSTFLTKYAKRPRVFSTNTLVQYFHHIKNQSGSKRYYIPHFVGASSQPIYPPTPHYARSILMIHMPWYETFPISLERSLSVFQHMMANQKFPAHVTIPYERLKVRFENGKEHHETINKEPIYDDCFQTEIPEDLNQLIQLTNTLPKQPLSSTDEEMENVCFGKNYDWSKLNHSVSFFCSVLTIWTILT